jgi:hypothetical protein
VFWVDGLDSVYKLTYELTKSYLGKSKNRIFRLLPMNPTTIYSFHVFGFLKEGKLNFVAFYPLCFPQPNEKGEDGTNPIFPFWAFKLVIWFYPSSLSGRQWPFRQTTTTYYIVNIRGFDPFLPMSG